MGTSIHDKLPMSLIQFYLLCTLVLYVFGPWEWKDNNMFLTVIILLAYQISTLLGYKLGRKVSRGERKRNAIHFRPRTIKIIIIIGFAITLLQCARTIGEASLLAFIRNVILGITDAASQYRLNQQTATYFGGSLVTYIIVLSAPLTWMAIPLSIFHFSQLNLPMKIIAIINIVFEALRWIAIGTNKGFIDVVLIIVFVAIIKYLCREKSRQIINSNKRRIIILGVLLGVIALYVFGNNVGSRVNNDWTNYEITNGYTYINRNAPLMMICPEAFKTLLILITSYLTQGYYAFSLCRRVKWIPMFGTGNSMFIMENINDFFGIELYQYTYQTRISSFNWDPFVNWHSFYVWVANDISIIGIIALMFIIGYVFYKVTYDAIFARDDLAIVLFCLFMIMFIYLPANNQILSYPTTFMAFWVLLFIWGITRHIRIRI